jgi:hypothetical protein
VLDGVEYGTGGTQAGDRATGRGALRGGGFDFSRIGSGEATREIYLDGTVKRARNQVIPVLAAGQSTTSSHRVNGLSSAVSTSADPAIGSAAGSAVTLACVSCHDPHGNGQYRILRRTPVDTGIATPAAGVRIPDARTKVYTTTNYWLSGDAGVPSVVGVNVGTHGSDGFIANIAQWCSTCHHRDRCPTKRKTGTEANCITCHVAHGSNAGVSGAETSTPEVKAIRAAPEVSTAPRVSGRMLRVDSGTECLMCHAF